MPGTRVLPVDPLSPHGSPVRGAVTPTSLLQTGGGGARHTRRERMSPLEATWPGAASPAWVPGQATSHRRSSASAVDTDAVPRTRSWGRLSPSPPCAQWEEQPPRLTNGGERGDRGAGVAATPPGPLPPSKAPGADRGGSSERSRWYRPPKASPPPPAPTGAKGSREALGEMPESA